MDSMAATRTTPPTPEEIDRYLEQALGLDVQVIRADQPANRWYKYPGDPHWSAPMPALYSEPDWRGAALLIRYYSDHQNKEDRRFDRRVNQLTGHHPSLITPAVIADAAWYSQAFYLGIDFRPLAGLGVPILAIQ